MTAADRPRLAPVALLALLAGACGDDAPASRPRAGRPVPAAVTIPPRVGPSPVRFVDATETSGVRFIQDNGYDEQGWFYVETLGSGLIAFDADSDEDVDLYFCTGHRLSGPPQDPAPGNAYFRNDGSGRFVEATGEAGLRDIRYSEGVCGADYDNDGDVDLYVTHFDEPNSLFQNDGLGHFTDVAAKAGVLGRSDGVDGACAFADVDNDGFVDLYVGGCVDHTRTKNKRCWDTPEDDYSTKLSRYCHPTDYQPLPDLLYRNRGDGTFEDFSKQAGIAGYFGRTLGLAFCDYDDDGDQDLFVACDRGKNFFLENDGKGHFHDISGENGTALSETGDVRAGMGTATGDFDGDGRIDLAATYFEREANGLYLNRGALQFEDVAEPTGTAAPSYPLLAWGTAFFDADLDGRLDWVVANGHIQPNLERFRKRPVGYDQPLLFFLNRGDRLFEELGAEAGEAVAALRPTRGLVTADLDGDGDLDLVLGNILKPATVLRNESPRAGNHWLLVKTVGTQSNRQGIGARVVAELPDRKLVAEVHTGQSYYSQSDTRVHFGLGTAQDVLRLDVHWPSGRKSHLQNVKADQTVTVVEPAE